MHVLLYTFGVQIKVIGPHYEYYNTHKIDTKCKT